jgi:hypothetical protein
LFLLFTTSHAVCAQNFETSWLGNYAGVLKLYNAKVDSVNVRLTLSRIDDWRTRYLMTYYAPNRPEIVKDYTIHADPNRKYNFIMDEGAGIQIQMKQYDNCFIDFYVVQNLWMSSSLCLFQNRAEFELRGGQFIEIDSKNAPKINTDTIVKSLPLGFLQKGIFYKIQ